MFQLVVLGNLAFFHIIPNWETPVFADQKCFTALPVGATGNGAFVFVPPLTGNAVKYFHSRIRLVATVARRWVVSHAHGLATVATLMARFLSPENASQRCLTGLRRPFVLQNL